MLRLSGGQVESLWDEVLMGGVHELPEDLAALDVLLRDPALLRPIADHWRGEAVSRGRPTISMEVVVRLMVVKQRTGWGYETLMREVSDSLHLRRFCLIALGERVPDESTVRKLTRRLGGEVVDELTRCVIVKAQRETRFQARAVRIDSTVVEADVAIRPTRGWRWTAQGAGARGAQGCAEGWPRRGLGDRSFPLDRPPCAGDDQYLSVVAAASARAVLELTAQAGKLVTRSIGEARACAAGARRARGRGAKAKLRQIRRLEQFIERAQRVAEQIEMRMRGERIIDRLVSIFDPDARPIRKGKLGKPNEFGYVTQICEVTENTKRGARGLIVPACSEAGNPQENTLLPHTIAELESSGWRRGR